MYHEHVQTAVIDDESLPWVPFAPYTNDVQLKYFKLDPIRGEMIVLMKAPAGMELPRHHHSGTVIVYTIEGRWKYKEHDWIAGPGSVVFETAASSHTPEAVGSEGHVVVLNIVVGDLIFLDANGQVMAIENWKTGLQRYLAYCEQAGITPRDLTAFG
ncbi:2,4'-dihydroxyacetophenone dioxygenase family protein [Lysobacter yangpyeongensis]|jgi:quercetin dioxygenase-like cupin family protein|uniref:2,4'-dihydroxyacetophenone dioxygenase family protein n=1 Tax=Lysobacter yangpyeongensis TaxID=346182 RepID=A0ABW0SJB2_9GAMM